MTRSTFDSKIKSLVKEQIKLLKDKNFTKNELCVYIMSIVRGVKLTHKDFEKIDLNEDAEESDDGIPS
jgi:hypothetical protein